MKDEDFLGVTGGVKFPTGETKNEDPLGNLFELEMQPGSGSYDYPVGIVYRHTISPIMLNGNASYVIKTKGAREFQYGDLFFASLNAEYVLNPKSANFQTKIGLNLTAHHAKKDTSLGMKSDDSGETSLFLGPGLNVKAGQYISIFGNIQLPVYQTTGGVHQKLDLLWTAGAKIRW